MDDLIVYLIVLGVGGLLALAGVLLGVWIGRDLEAGRQLSRHVLDAQRLELERATLLHTALEASEDYGPLDRAG